ncbi:class I SAM-dependent methyltransferase [Rhizobium ruizarguesonis]|jgi:2-polyprenyl-3-methyl-5-hydroxy-6-metoxy-1,4-benzoquinol methylase|uniref:class I SAM-dependent methyltransferase n=1 Tax=Rhizobium TaxID=379 RepID=UPI00040632CD|nr:MULTISPECIES: class I SAM-dependent methyltransferase [Rhizobium]TBB57987.1 class I SAM-dependent methyltransferase [Rhizobium ruizarguesonis]
MDARSVNNYESYAEFYDNWQDSWPESVMTPCVNVLSDIAAGRPALELAVGTGRIALPLSQRGIEVSGVDLSEAMLARLRRKPGAEKLSIVQGDMVDVPFEGTFGLIYCIASFEYLLTQEDQLRFFANVEKRLAIGGSVIIQTIIPNEAFFSNDFRLNRMSDLPSGEHEMASVMLMGVKGDPVTQVLDQRIMVLGEKSQVFRHKIRFVWPNELDLLARSAGLSLHARWNNWQRDAFVSTSRLVISEYRRA